MKTPRKSISKRVRFSIFARDNFTCRYCGRQSDVVKLEIDHIHPVCQGGTNDEENLIAACQDCNAGKSGRTIPQTVPNEVDRLRLAQERNEQALAYEAAKASMEARLKTKALVEQYWRGITGRETTHAPTMSIIVRYMEEHGAQTVFQWIDSAAHKFEDKISRRYWSADRLDEQMGMYVSGIRRSVMKGAIQ